MIMSIYNSRCAVCDLALVEMLIASHIVPWSGDKNLRVNPRNGLSLCSFHDKAFDTGLFTLDDSFSVLLSKRARKQPVCEMQKVGLLEVEGKHIYVPKQFAPDKDAVAIHRQTIFRP
jgi:putative restriction endonuclease